MCQLSESRAGKIIRHCRALHSSASMRSPVIYTAQCIDLDVQLNLPASPGNYTQYQGCILHDGEQYGYFNIRAVCLNLDSSQYFLGVQSTGVDAGIISIPKVDHRNVCECIGAIWRIVHTLIQCPPKEKCVFSIVPSMFLFVLYFMH